jgi:hypothetical protein
MAEIYVNEKALDFHLDKIYTKIGVGAHQTAGVRAIQQGIAKD